MNWTKWKDISKQSFAIFSSFRDKTYCLPIIGREWTCRSFLWKNPLVPFFGSRIFRRGTVRRQKEKKVIIWLNLTEANIFLLWSVHGKISAHTFFISKPVKCFLFARFYCEQKSWLSMYTIKFSICVLRHRKSGVMNVHQAQHIYLICFL